MGPITPASIFNNRCHIQSIFRSALVLHLHEFSREPTLLSGSLLYIFAQYICLKLFTFYFKFSKASYSNMLKNIERNNRRHCKRNTCAKYTCAKIADQKVQRRSRILKAKLTNLHIHTYIHTYKLYLITLAPSAIFACFNMRGVKNRTYLHS